MYISDCFVTTPVPLEVFSLFLYAFEYSVSVFLFPDFFLRISVSIQIQYFGVKAVYISNKEV